MSVEEDFVQELNIFNNEIYKLTGSLYTELSIQEVALKNKAMLSAINHDPLFWKVILYSLQQSTFTTLGRICDQDSPHNIHRLFSIANKNLSIFSKKAFSERWAAKNSDPKMQKYLEEYLEHVYEPLDIRQLMKEKAQLQQIYVKNYRAIRNSFSHINEDSLNINNLFSGIKIIELEKYCVRLHNIHDALWQLYHNGRDPLKVKKQRKNSTRYILKMKFKTYHSIPTNAQYAKNVKSVLSLLKNGYRDLLGKAKIRR